MPPKHKLDADSKASTTAKSYSVTPPPGKRRRSSRIADQDDDESLEVHNTPSSAKPKDTSKSDEKISKIEHDSPLAESELKTENLEKKPSEAATPPPPEISHPKRASVKTPAYTISG